MSVHTFVLFLPFPPEMAFAWGRYCRAVSVAEKKKYIYIIIMLNCESGLG